MLSQHIFVHGLKMQQLTLWYTFSIYIIYPSHDGIKVKIEKHAFI